MKTLQQIICLSVIVLFSGCVSSASLGRLSVGMKKNQVVEILGRPHVVAAQGDTEYLSYNLDVESVGGKREYFVKLVNGIVQSYGRRGDFDTTLGSRQRIEINQR